jgi:hypothetical protein
VLRDMAPGEARLRDEGWAIQPVASTRLDTPGSS